MSICDNNKSKPEVLCSNTTQPVIITPLNKIADSISADMLVVDGIRKYILGNTIAEGGMGILYQAYDSNCKRTVAMKVLYPRDETSSEELLRFVEEAQITAQLEHSNIVPIYEVGIDQHKRVYYTMKYIKGHTLTDVLIGLRKNDPVFIDAYPLSRLLNIFQKVCDAVAYAHAREVIHRDLKPDNIMIANYGEVHVVDWGLAKPLSALSNYKNKRSVDPEMIEQDVIHSLRNEKIGSSLNTMSGHIMGTPGFMAPEQARIETDQLSLQSDIYSLGAILYSILTLRPPLRPTQYQNAKALIEAIHANDVTPPTQCFNYDADETSPIPFPHCPNGQVPEPLSRITMRALSTNPGERCQSVIELQQEVESYQNGSAWHLLVDDDFSDPDCMQHWEVAGGHCDIAEGALRMVGGEPQVLLFKQDVPGDVRIEYQAHIRSIYLNNLGCFVNGINKGNKQFIPFSGYEFCYGAFDNSLNQLCRANQQLWSENNSPLEQNAVYNITAERNEKRLSLTVNGKTIFDIEDTKPLSGISHSAVGIYGWLSDVRYTRIKIYSRNIPWQADILDIAERQLQKENFEVAETLYRDIIKSNPDKNRLKRAKHGLASTRQRQILVNKKAKWEADLHHAWPNAQIELSLVNDNISIEISNNEIDDLTPLTDMPVCALYCQNNKITSLEPLRGMPLETLNCNDNPVEDLSPLSGTPLTNLSCENCSIRTLEPLHTLNLTQLNCGGCHYISDLAPLKKMHLGYLICWGNKIKSLEPIGGMQLTGLFCGENEISDLEPLYGMPLKMLHCSGNRISSLEPLRGMLLSSLHCADNIIESLDPLKDMSIKMLSCHINRIKTLEPLAKMMPSTLTCGGNLLTDISPFDESPPADFTFDCETIPIEQLKKTKALWIKNIVPEHHIVNIDVLIALREKRLDDLMATAQSFNNCRYLFIPKFMDWEEARQFCKELGGDLLSILSADENWFVNSMFPNGCWFWLGLSQTESGLQWIDGSPYEFDNFVNDLQRNKPGPKIFNGSWRSDDNPRAKNCFMIKWHDFPHIPLAHSSDIG